MIKVYDTNYGSKVGKFTIKDIDKLSSKNKSTKTSAGVETVIILDISGSMSSYVQRIVTQYIPNALVKMGVKKKVTLITFGSTSKVYSYTVDEFRKSPIRSDGATYMEHAVHDLKKVISGSKSNNFRILSISDGELHDQTQTLNTATMLAKHLAGNYQIHSSAIRLFTSSSQPDTRGLASILQLNTVGNAQLIDFKFSQYSAEEFVNVFANAMQDDLGSSIKLVSSVPVFMVNPWSMPVAELYLSEGDNTFWLNPVGNGAIIKLYAEDTILDANVSTNIESKLDLQNFGTILKEKIDYYVKRLKLLKVVDMAESKDEISKIVSYFTQLEKTFALHDKTDVDLSTDTSIKSRLKFFKNKALRQSKSIVQELASIANQDKVSQLNSAQQADYLRSATVSSNTINLAKRGLQQGFDFDEKAVAEVKAMRQHLSELDSIDDSTHSVSFYSQDTTLGGIKAVCSLDDVSLNNLGALEILQILNIVGVPCEAVIGDFPDPKTYHISDLMLGTYISMSDIMICRQLEHPITHPFNKKLITNTIPFYDDDRIQQFLMKYAPNILEYTGSLGMRNMLINIPSTYKYTIVDGVWWMARELQDNPTEVNAKLFTKFVHTYRKAVGTLFDYVPKLIVPMSKEDKDNNLSLYIGNNGVTNMIGPLIALQTDSEKMKMIPDILRALYTFEYYQVLRKYYRTDADGYIKRKEMLDNLLGIDFTKYATKLPTIFESQKVPRHHEDCHINQTIYDEVSKRIYWIDYLCQLPKMIGYALSNDTESLLKLSSIKNSSALAAELGISFDLTKFKLCCMTQGLMYDTLASRYDDQKDKMKIEDCGNEKRMDDFLSDYIKRQYYSNYQSELSKQNKQEVEILTGELVEMLVKADQIKDFNDLLRNGTARNHVSVAITDTFKDGFTNLRDKLFNPLTVCANKDKKLRVLVMGSDINGNIVYNKGNTMRMPLPELDRLFNEVGFTPMWKTIRDEYIEKSIHLYRTSDFPNRHTHCNSKPSYYAYGYSSLGKYFAVIGKAEQDSYCAVHTHCCGVWDGKPYRWA